MSDTMGYTQQQPQPPEWMEAMDHIPNMTQGAGFQAFRTTNTILHGPYSTTQTGAARQYLNPRSYTRYGTYNPFTPHRVQSEVATAKRGMFKVIPDASGGVAPGHVYDPFQASQFTNWVGRRTPLGAKAASMGAGEIVSGGFIGQMGAASRLAKGAGAGKAMTWALEMNPNTPVKYVMNAGKAGDIGAAARAGAVRNARTGLINQAYGGAVQATQFGMNGMAGGGGRAAFRRIGTYVASDLAKMGLEDGMGVGVRAAGQGLKTGLLHLAEKKAAGEVGKRATAMAAGRLASYAALSAADGPLPFGEIASAIWLAYDVTKLGLTAGKAIVKAEARFLQQAGRSFAGDIGKAPMSSPFRDSEAAMTSRSRGVMAIQNSRLNARSVLGSEAGAMHAYYG